MRIIVGILSTLYGALAIVPVALVSGSAMLATAAESELSPGNVAMFIIAAVAVLAAMGMLVGGVGILRCDQWGTVTAGAASLIVILGAFAFFFTMAVGAAMAPGASVAQEVVLAIARALAVAVVPMFVYWWCWRPVAKDSHGPSPAEKLAALRNKTAQQHAEPEADLPPRKGDTS